MCVCVCVCGRVTRVWTGAVTHTLRVHARAPTTLALSPATLTPPTRCCTQVSGRAVDRQVELRAACSPDTALHLLVREPEFCRYIMVLYHPHLCKVRELKPVSVLTALEALASTSKAGSGGVTKVGAGSSSSSSSTAAGSKDAGSASAVHEDSGGGEDEDEAAGSGTRHTTTSLRATDGGRGGRGSSGGSELPKKRVITSGPSGAGHDESGDEQQQQQQKPRTKGKLSTS